MANLEGEWLHRNKNRAFPFVERSPTAIFAPAVSGDVDDALVSYFADANIVVSQGLARGRELKLNSFRFSISQLRLQFDDDAYFEPSSFSSTVSDDSRYRTVRFAGISGGAANDDLSGVIVINIEAEAHTLDAEVSFPAGDEPSFAARCVDAQPNRIDEISLNVGGVLVSLGEIGNFIEGTNIRLTDNPTDPRFTLLDQRRDTARGLFNRILIEANPGAGSGKNPTDCTAVITDVRTLNLKPPQIGDFQLQGDSCYRVERESGSVVDNDFTATPGRLQISNDCQTCCDCSEFVDLLEEIRALKDLGRLVSKRWSSVRKLYDEVLALWDAKRACIGTGCIAQLFGYSFTGWKVQVTTWVGNTDSCSKGGSHVSVNFTGGDFVPVYVPGSGFIYNESFQYTQSEPSESGGVFTMQDNNAIKGGGYQMFVFAVRMALSNDRVDGNLVGINAVVNACDEAPETLVSSVKLLSNTNKD